MVAVLVVYGMRCIARPDYAHRRLQLPLSTREPSTACYIHSTLTAMAYNNAYILESITSSPHAPLSPEASSSTSPFKSPTPLHKSLPHDPTLPSPLPPLSHLLSESRHSSSLELERQTLQLQRERELAEALVEQERSEAIEEVKKEQGGWALGRLIAGRGRGQGKGKGGTPGEGWEGEGKTKPFERKVDAFELYQAIDRKDLT